MTERTHPWGRGDAFNAEMLQLARIAASVSQSQLANELGVGQNTLSRWESALRVPSEIEVEHLASILDRPINFFYRSERPLAVDAAFMFHRKRARTPLTKLRPLHARINIARLGLVDILKQIESWDVHVHRLPIEECASATEAARKIRASWQVSPGPIRDLVGLVEAAGAIVFSFDFACHDIDAIGIWPWDTPPLMFINSSAPADRMRFSLAHELGHLVLHQVPSETMESEANEFASELLFPGVSAKTELQNISPDSLWRLKQRWRVSAQCLVRRAKDTKMIDERRYTSLMSYFSRKGWRKQEPFPIDGEEPTTLDRITSAFRYHLGYGVEELRELLGVTSGELSTIFNVRTERPKLRVISDGPRRPR